MTALFPGSFDPVTLGHLDLLKRGVKIFDNIIVAVLHNAAKQPLFTVDERIAMLKSHVECMPNVQVQAYSGLLAEFANKQKARYILRGIRSEADCAYELPMAQANRQLGQASEKGLETVFLITDPAYAHVSSALVREAAAAGYASGFDDKVLEQWVSPYVKNMLKNKYNANLNLQKQIGG